MTIFNKANTTIVDNETAYNVSTGLMNFDWIVEATEETYTGFCECQAPAGDSFEVFHVQNPSWTNNVTSNVEEHRVFDGGF